MYFELLVIIFRSHHDVYLKAMKSSAQINPIASNPDSFSWETLMLGNFGRSMEDYRDNEEEEDWVMPSRFEILFFLFLTSRWRRLLTIVVEDTGRFGIFEMTTVLQNKIWLKFVSEYGMESWMS